MNKTHPLVDHQGGHQDDHGQGGALVHGGDIETRVGQRSGGGQAIAVGEAEGRVSLLQKVGQHLVALLGERLELSGGVASPDLIRALVQSL